MDFHPTLFKCILFERLATPTEVEDAVIDNRLVRSLLIGMAAQNFFFISV